MPKVHWWGTLVGGQKRTRNDKGGENQKRKGRFNEDVGKVTSNTGHPSPKNGRPMANGV